MRVGFLGIEKLGKKDRVLLKHASRVRKRAYAPYSKFLVGAVLVDENGKIHTGCNVENASFTAGICAERAAIAKLVSRGAKQIKRVLIVSSSDEPALPCGVCLQAINEFGRNATVVAVNKSLSKFCEYPLSKLFPYSFNPEDVLDKSVGSLEA